ncbi:MAG: tol-pal system-associated acyl-CoA thioesterase [Betaproteobacteria bacterium]|nr:tol-pal system-associated acyl-CoA thioesterase [Betaproteobacteria bacterium]
MSTSQTSSPPAQFFADATQSPTFTLPIRIYYEDTDAGGVVYYANYLRFCERARSEWLRALGFGQQQLLATGGPLFVVRRVQAEYLAPARLDDNLTVISTIHDLKNVSVLFFQRIFCGSKLLFTAEVKVASVSPGNGRPVPWPDAVRTQLHDQLSPCLSR